MIDHVVIGQLWKTSRAIALESRTENPSFNFSSPSHA